MKQSKITLFYAYLFILFSLFCFEAPVCSGFVSDGDKWSFNFENCKVSDALSQIAAETGIQIYFSKSIDERVISKNYSMLTIDQIITDLFHRENYAIIWNFSGNRLSHIKISTLDSGQDGENFQSEKLSNREQVGSNNNDMKNNAYKSVLGKKTNRGIRNFNASRQSKFDPPIHIEDSANGEQVVSNTSSNQERPIVARRNAGGGNSENPQSPESPPMDKKMEQSFSNEKAKLLTPAIPEKWKNIDPPPMPPGFASFK